MDKVFCPHCKSHQITTSQVPEDVVVVMPCPGCRELCVLYRGRVIALNRRVIEYGTREERKEHLASVIAEFLEAGMLSLEDNDLPSGVDAAGLEEQLMDPEELDLPEEQYESPITDEEFQKFVRIDLKCLDNAAYFRRHFG